MTDYLIAVPLVEQSFVDDSCKAIVQTIHSLFEGKPSEYGFQWVYMVSMTDTYNGKREKLLCDYGRQDELFQDVTACLQSLISEKCNSLLDAFASNKMTVLALAYEFWTDVYGNILTVSNLLNHLSQSNSM